MKKKIKNKKNMTTKIYYIFVTFEKLKNRILSC